MAVFAWIVMSPAEAGDAVALNDGDAGLAPLAIDNPLANNLGFGTLVGKQVVPARVLNDPACARWWPTLGTYPIHVMDSDTLFLPPPEDG